MKTFALLLLTLCIGHMALCQDIITRRNGDKIRAKVSAVREHEIDYTLQDNLNGPLHTILKSDVSVINYDNGTKDEFDSAPEDNNENNSTLAERGAADAKMYYKANNAELGAALSALYPFYGAISAVVISSTRPRYERLNFPDERLMDNRAYRTAYENKAFKIKKGKTWEGFGIGTGILVSVIAAVIIGTSIN
ncbi:MAG: hypothetical protein JWQ38_705 [Flavipsychrobacter sp.]|nr:hypothetical protein [Flavipsychrobacter sp.]